MTQQHPITPPPELVEEWIEIAKPEPWKRPPDPNVLCSMAAQWGADKELEACLTEVSFLDSKSLAEKIRATRRPEPPSLKEQALETLKYPKDLWSENEVDTIRRALEQIDD
jgi:hypothetical protein